ncbi:Asx homology domain-containing protein [Trichoderma barbatum]
MLTANPASVGAGSTPKPMKTEIASSSPLSSLGSDIESPFTPVRPRRSVAATKRFASPSNDDSKSIPQRPKKRTPAAKKARTPKKPKWDAENILKDPKSPLATANLRSILCNPLTWAALDQDEKAEILALFPDKGHILDSGTEDARPNFGSLMNDDSFRYDCAVYTENIAQGRHDPEWLASAWSAHERRKAGEFDKYLGDKLEEEWGVEIPEDMKIRREMPEAEQRAEAEKGLEAEKKPEANDNGNGDLTRKRFKRLDDSMDVDELAL